MRLTRYVSLLPLVLFSLMSAFGQSPEAPNHIPCRVNDQGDDLFLMSLGNVTTEIAHGWFDARNDEVVLNDGRRIPNYYRDSVRIRFFRPIDKSRYPGAFLLSADTSVSRTWEGSYNGEYFGAWQKGRISPCVTHQQEILRSVSVVRFIAPLGDPPVRLGGQPHEREVGISFDTDDVTRVECHCQAESAGDHRAE